jgi:hypothetical protein
LIGSIRRECIDHAIVLGEAHLRRIMSRYARYYNESRTHLALRKDAPVSRSIELLGRVIAHPVVGGLDHRYARIYFRQAQAGFPAEMNFPHLADEAIAPSGIKIDSCLSYKEYVITI